MVNWSFFENFNSNSSKKIKVNSNCNSSPYPDLLDAILRINKLNWVNYSAKSNKCPLIKCPLIKCPPKIKIKKSSVN